MTRLQLSGVTVAICFAMAQAGCIVVTNGTKTYDRCITSSDCTAVGDTCRTITTSTGASDSICTSTCSFDSDCAFGGYCLKATGVCVDRCSSSAECPLGWSCLLTESNNVCLPGTGSTGAATYDRCTPSGGCANAGDSCQVTVGNGAQDSICTRVCNSDLDCSGGGLCDKTQGICLETCSTSAQCPSSFTCGPTPASNLSVCHPGPTFAGVFPYEDCSNGEQCWPGTSCTEILNGTAAPRDMCTTSCSVQNCPRDIFGNQGLCAPTSPPTCFQTCLSNNDCLVGWTCKNALGTLSLAAPVCVPM